MKYSIAALLILASLVSCGKKSKTKFYPITETNLSKYVNDKDLPANPNLTLDKSIVNNDYPIQLALYRNGKFYYDLPNLDEGNGTWTYSNGQIVLKSKHRLFDMRIDVRAVDDEANNLAVSFIDRHGPQTLKMDNQRVE